MREGSGSVVPASERISRTIIQYGLHSAWRLPDPVQVLKRLWFDCREFAQRTLNAGRGPVLCPLQCGANTVLMRLVCGNDSVGEPGPQMYFRLVVTRCRAS